MQPVSSTERTERTYVVKFSDDAELTLQLSPTALCSDLINQVRRRKQLPHATTVIRLIAAGRELRGDMPLAQLASSVLHCSITEAPPAGEASGAGTGTGTDSQSHVLQAPAPEPGRSQLLTLVDSTDPGILLLFILGAVLVLACCVLMQSNFYLDTKSVVILGIMAAMLIIPCCLGYILPSGVSTPSPQELGSPSPTGAMGAQAARGPTARSTGGMFIPARPRPEARPQT